VHICAPATPHAVSKGQRPAPCASRTQELSPAACFGRGMNARLMKQDGGSRGGGKGNALTVDKVKLVTLWASENRVARDRRDWGFDVLVVAVNVGEACLARPRKRQVGATDVTKNKRREGNRTCDTMERGVQQPSTHASSLGPVGITREEAQHSTRQFVGARGSTGCVLDTELLRFYWQGLPECHANPTRRAPSWR